MSSKKSPVAWDELDLERDMPTTAVDVEALERARQLEPLSPETYLRWVELLAQHHPSPSRELNSDSDEPFTL